MTFIFGVNMSFVDIRIKELGEEVAILQAEYETLKNESRNALSSVERDRLDRQAEDLYQRGVAKEEELKKLEEQKARQDPNRSHLNREQKLSEFDFTDAVDTFEEIVKNYLNKKGGGAAIFLLQHSLAMGGKRCIVRLRELLRKKTRETNFRHYPIKLSYTEQNEFGLLRRLAGYLNVESNPEAQEQCVQNIIRKVHLSVPEPGHIVFIELTGIDYLSGQEHVLPWLIENFWRPLCRELPNTAKKYPYVKFVCLIVADGEIPCRCIPESICCTKEDFELEKIVELPLRKCSPIEIERWLYSFWQVPPEAPENAIEQIARVIHEASEGGKPDLVCLKFMEL